MAIQDYKVSESYSGRDVSSLPNKPNQNGFSAEQLKARFDQLGKEVIPQYNDLIDFLNTNLFSGGSTEGHTHNIDNIEDGVTNKLFTSDDNNKLDGIEAGAEVNNISDLNATDLTDGGDSTLHYHSSDRNTDNHVSGLTNKVFSATEQNKLQGIQAGAEVNQFAYSSVKVGSSTSSATSKTDIFEIVAGLNIVAVLDTVNKKLTLSATGDIATEASQSLVVDVGGYYTGDNVEDVLQEIGLALSSLGGDFINSDGSNSSIVRATFADGSYIERNTDRKTWIFADADGTQVDMPRELYYPENKASGAIGNGVPTQFAGVQGDHTLSKVAVPSEINANPRLFMGLSTKAHVNNDWTKIANFGVVHDVDTNGFAIGTILYYDSINGGLTNILPPAPYAQIEVGAVMVASPTVGAILVRITFLQNASQVAIEDVGTYYTSTDVEGALQEVGASLATKEPAFTKNTAFNKNYSTVTTDIKMNGTQSLGSLDTLARADHVHPSDTSRAPLANPEFTGTPKINGIKINSTTLSKTLATASWVADGAYWKYAIPITEAEAGLISTSTKIELIPLERSTFGTAALFKTYLDLIQNANIQGESITATISGTGYVNIISMGTKPTSDVTITVVVRGD